MRSVKGFLKRQSPTILTCVGATGVVVTSVLLDLLKVKCREQNIL